MADNITPLQAYIDQLTHLHVSHARGFKAPHKAILMISVTELIRDLRIGSPVITLSDSLRNKFVGNWRKFIQINTPFICDINMPFPRMGTEKFVVSSSEDSFELDKALFYWMRDQECSEEILASLIAQYLAPFAFKHKVSFAELNPYRDKKLYPYQAEAKAKIYKMWTQLRSIMFQMPTGTGKTHLFVSIARDLFDWSTQHKEAVTILFLAHRVELIRQIKERLGLKYGLAAGMIAANNMEEEYMPYQVASVQTLIRRLDKWSAKEFDIIIVDEAHHVKAESYKKILRAFPSAKVLGVTATPYRMSHESFRPEFDDLITSMPVSRFIKEGWLCDYEYYSIRPESRIQMDIDSITRFAMDGDYLDEAAADVMDRDEIRAGIVASYEHYAKGMKGIVYTITKAHNIHVCSQFVARGYKAVAIDDSTPAKVREGYVKDFICGRIDIICNVNIFSEGFDCPDVEFIQLARPTKSLSMYLQQVGRGLRTAAGKEKVIILDNVGLYNRFGFPSARRQWRRHFEGYDFDYSVPYGTRVVDGREVFFMDEFEEGEEEVEMLHDSKEEVVEGAELQNGVENIYANEPEFRFYLEKKGKDDSEVKRIIRGIKGDVDTIIRRKYDSGHKSILGMTDIGALELYLYDFQVTPVMAEMNTAKKMIMTSSLETYINYLKWRQTDDAIATNPVDIDNMQEEQEEIAPERSIADVELEISVFKKWNKDIPDELLQEYADLKRTQA